MYLFSLPAKARIAEELIVGIAAALLIVFAWTVFWGTAWWRVKRTTKHSDSLVTYGAFVGLGLFVLFEVIFYSTSQNGPLSLAVVAGTFIVAVLTISVLRTVNRRLLAKQPAA